MQNVSKEAEKTAGSIADAAPEIADRVSDRLGREADQIGREVKPAAEKVANRISSEADQLGKEARPMADKASSNIEARAREAGEQARPAADNASEAMKKTADDASGEILWWSMHAVGAGAVPKLLLALRMQAFAYFVRICAVALHVQSALVLAVIVVVLVCMQRVDCNTLVQQSLDQAARMLLLLLAIQHFLFSCVISKLLCLVLQRH